MNKEGKKYREIKKKLQRKQSIKAIIKNHKKILNAEFKAKENDVKITEKDVVESKKQLIKIWKRSKYEMKTIAILKHSIEVKNNVYDKKQMEEIIEMIQKEKVPEDISVKKLYKEIEDAMDKKQKPENSIVDKILQTATQPAQGTQTITSQNTQTQSTPVQNTQTIKVQTQVAQTQSAPAQNVQTQVAQTQNAPAQNTQTIKVQTPKKNATKTKSSSVQNAQTQGTTAQSVQTPKTRNSEPNFRQSCQLNVGINIDSMKKIANLLKNYDADKMSPEFKEMLVNMDEKKLVSWIGCMTKDQKNAEEAMLAISKEKENIELYNYGVEEIKKRLNEWKDLSDEEIEKMENDEKFIYRIINGYKVAEEERKQQIQQHQAQKEQETQEQAV